MTKTIDQLIAERIELTDIMSECDGGFPGSKGYNAQTAAMANLRTFDRENPTILGEIRSRKSVARTPDQILGM